MAEITGQTVEKQPEMSGLNKIINIFTDPGSVFRAIRERPTWLLPFSLVMLMSVVFTVSTEDLILKYQKEAIYNSTLIPEDQKDEIIEKYESKTPTRRHIESVIAGVVNVTVLFVVVAGIFWIVGNFVLGGTASYKQIFSMYSWVGMVSVLELLVKLPLSLAKESLNVYTSLAVLMDPAQSKTILFQILNAFDIFTIWKIVLWGMGFSIIYNFSKEKSYAAVISLYIIYLIGAIGFAQIFQG